MSLRSKISASLSGSLPCSLPGIKTGLVCALLLSTVTTTAWAAGGPLDGISEFDFTLIATNDTHCRLKPDTSPMKLGGFARLKTAIQKYKDEQPNTLVLDGGDWAEGSIYYTLDAGAECLKMIDRIGVDYSVVGNHDWLNGPGLLLDAVETVKPKMTLLSANVDLSQFSKAQEFQEKIPPYVIKDMGGLRVALIGLSTYEWIYDRYMEPVKIMDPLRITYEITHAIKQENRADVIVAISHNSIFANKAILKYAPDIDIIVGAHDHKTLTHAVEVSRWPWGSGTGYIVEGGSWGRYLTKMDLHYSKKNGLKFKSELVQIDQKFAEDPGILNIIQDLDSRLENQRGPIFHDEVGIAQRQFFRDGVESQMGNLVTDSYRAATGAEIGLESYRFIYGELYSGPIRTADVMNVNPAVYSAATGKTWTLKKVSVLGKTLKRMLSLAYGPSILSYHGFFSVSGVSFAYDPWFNREEGTPYSLSRFFKAVGSVIAGPSISGVQDIKVGQEPLDVDKTYTVAMGEGVLQGIEFINSYLGQVLPVESVQDTGTENWQVLAEHIRTLRTLDRVNIKGGRIQTLKPDLGISYEDISWKPLAYTDQGMKAEISVRVRNYGRSDSRAGGWLSGGPSLHIYKNKNGDNLALDPEYEDLAVPFSLPSIEAQNDPVFVWTATVPQVNGRFPVIAKIEGVDNEVNPTNNTMTRWFTLEKDPILTYAEERMRREALGRELY